MRRSTAESKASASHEDNRVILDATNPQHQQGGRWQSVVLGLDLAVEDGQLRFYHGAAALLDARELIVRLSTMVDQVTERAEQEAQRAEQEAQRAEQEAQRAARYAARLREAGIDPEEDES